MDESWQNMSQPEEVLENMSQPLALLLEADGQGGGAVGEASGEGEWEGEEEAEPPNTPLWGADDDEQEEQE